MAPSWSRGESSQSEESHKSDWFTERLFGKSWSRAPVKCSVLEPSVLQEAAALQEVDMSITRPDETTSTGPVGGWLLLVVVLLGAGFRFFLTASLPTLLPYYPVDDTLYLRSAYHLSQGEWLGPYDYTTLAKAAGYPLFLAGAHLLGLSRRLAEDSLLIAACLTLVWALRRLGVNRFLAAIAFLACLFSQGETSEVLYRAVRENIYASQTLLVFSLGLVLVTVARWWARVLAGTALGLVLGWFWCTREEGVWILPSLGILALVLLVAERSRGESWARACVLMLLTALLPVATSGLWVSVVREHNRAAYGVADWGLNEPDFAAAVDGLNRVAASRWKRWQPLDRDLWERLYRASPALASLRKYLDGSAYRSPIQLAENGEQMAVYRMWALRTAAANQGYHVSATAAREFYRRMAEEIHGACDRGEIPAGPRRNAIVPYFHESLYPILAATWWARMRDAWEGRARLHGAFMGAEFPNQSRIPPRLAGPIQEVLGEPAHHSVTRVTEYRFRLLQCLHLANQRLVPWLHGLGAAACVVLILLARRIAFFWLGITLTLVVAVALRAFLIAAIETYWWPFAASYLLCAYALVPVTAAIALQGAATAVATTRVASEVRRRLPPSVLRMVPTFLVLAVVILAAAYTGPAWRMAWERSHPGIPLQPYTQVETTGGRFFLRQGQVSGEANGGLVLTRTSRGLSAMLTVFPTGGSLRDRELEIAVAFEGAGVLADWKARWQSPKKEQRENSISVRGPGFHNYRVPLPITSRPPLLLEIIGPDDPCSAIIIRSLKLVSRRPEQVETGAAGPGTRSLPTN